MSDLELPRIGDWLVTATGGAAYLVVDYDPRPACVVLSDANGFEWPAFVKYWRPAMPDEIPRRHP